MNTIDELHKAAVQLSIAFERMQKLVRSEQAEALRSASATLIDMRRACDDLARRRF